MAVTALVTLLAKTAWATPQETPSASSSAKGTFPSEATASTDPETENPATNSETVDQSDLASRLEKAEAENRARAEQAKAQEKRITALEARLNEVQAAADESLLQDVNEFTPTLDIYGFFDVSLTRWWLADGDASKLTIPEDLSFAATGFNVYLLSQMTPSIQFLAEVNFSYMPHGSIDNTNLELQDTTTLHPYNAKAIRLGSTYIERMQLTWQPRDWFGVTAGRFITPFGIWNIDHGSPVLLPIFAPFIMVTDIVMPRQTGVMVHGRFVPTESWILEYALTVSNGRGRYDQVFDMDDSKAVGLRLRSELTVGEAELNMGVYGFWCQSTEKETVMVELDPFRVGDRIDSRFHELTLSTDLQLKLFGVTLQGEWAGSRRKYKTRPPRTMSIIEIEYPDYEPDYIAQVAYVLLAWELPLDELIGDMRITPYAMLEWSNPKDFDTSFDLWLIRFGVNVKPTAVIVLKLEGGYLKMLESEFYSKPSWQIGAQVAVAF